MKTRMLFVLMSIAAVALFWHSTGCKKNPVSPEPRNLSWSVDTLSHPDNWQVSISDIWASSTKDVYAAGVANTTRGILWHYDGNRWRDIKISITQGGPIAGSIGFNDIYGFGSSDIFLAGDRFVRNSNPPPDYSHESLVVHYDGTEWHEIPSPPGNTLTSVWGSSPDNIWFGGIASTLFHYDGNQISAVASPFSQSEERLADYDIMSMSGHAERAYMLVRVRRTRYFLYEYGDKKAWQAVDSTFSSFARGVWQSSWGPLYLLGDGTLRRESDQNTLLLDPFQTLRSYGIHGNRQDNLFVVGKASQEPYPGVLYHYNGQDWSIIHDMVRDNQALIEVWTDGREVFIVARSEGTISMVYHGK